MNLADSERMAGTLEAAGYACVSDPEDADVLIYNTCSIRDKAEQKVYSALGRQVGALMALLLSTLPHLAMHKIQLFQAHKDTIIG